MSPERVPPVALCVLRCERRSYGILVTLTRSADIESSAGPPQELRLRRAGPVLDEIRRFLAEIGVPE